MNNNMRLNGDNERNHGDQSSEELGLEDTNWVCNMRIGRKDKKKKTSHLVRKNPKHWSQNLLGCVCLEVK